MIISFITLIANKADWMGFLPSFPPSSRSKTERPAFDCTETTIRRKSRNVQAMIRVATNPHKPRVQAESDAKDPENCVIMNTYSICDANRGSSSELNQQIHSVMPLGGSKRTHPVQPSAFVHLFLTGASQEGVRCARAAIDFSCDAFPPLYYMG